MDRIVLDLRAVLISESAPLAQRFRALFSLKHIASLPTNPSTNPAITAIAAALSSPSALVKHELAYCLGQSRKREAIPFLIKVLEKEGEDPMCRHEAAEALAAIGDEGSLAVLRRFRDKEGEEVVVRETCEISVARIEWLYSEEGKTEKLRQRFVLDIFQRLWKIG